MCVCFEILNSFYKVIFIVGFEGSTVMSPAAKALLAEPGFQLSSLKFILGEEGQNKELENKKPFSFLMCKC